MTRFLDRDARDGTRPARRDQSCHRLRRDGQASDELTTIMRACSIRVSFHGSVLVGSDEACCSVSQDGFDQSSGPGQNYPVVPPEFDMPGLVAPAVLQPRPVDWPPATTRLPQQAGHSDEPGCYPIEVSRNGLRLRAVHVCCVVGFRRVGFAAAAQRWRRRRSPLRSTRHR